MACFETFSCTCFGGWTIVVVMMRPSLTRNNEAILKPVTKLRLRKRMKCVKTIVKEFIS